MLLYPLSLQEYNSHSCLCDFDAMYVIVLPLITTRIGLASQASAIVLRTLIHTDDFAAPCINSAQHLLQLLHLSLCTPCEPSGLL